MKVYLMTICAPDFGSWERVCRGKPALGSKVHRASRERSARWVSYASNASEYRHADRATCVPEAPMRMKLYL